MITIEPALHDVLARLVELEAGLFREDAGRHDPFADTTWPPRKGHTDFDRLLADPRVLVLVARDGTQRVITHAHAGHLRRVAESVRGGRASEQPNRHQLTEAFIAWARTHGCAEAHVESYSANEAAQRVYERVGFQARSVSRALRF